MLGATASGWHALLGGLGQRPFAAMEIRSVFHERRIREVWDIHSVRFFPHSTILLLGCFGYTPIAAFRAFALAVVCHFAYTEKTETGSERLVIKSEQYHSIIEKCELIFNPVDSDTGRITIRITIKVLRIRWSPGCHD
jgi:hypothetical protein